MMRISICLLLSLLLLGLPLRTRAQIEEKDPVETVLGDQETKEEFEQEELGAAEERDEKRAEDEEEELEPKRGGAQEEVREIEDEGLEAEEERKISIDGAIAMNYLFENSSDTFVVKYSFHIDGEAKANTSVMQGKMKTEAQVEGFLAKWPGGECKLSITIPEVDYEMVFRKTSDTQGRLNWRTKSQISETWKSTCLWPGSGSKFETIGDPERWFDKALAKARPPLSSIGLDVKEEATTTTFTIRKQVVGDPPLGTAEIEGTGVITVRPKKPGE